VAERAPRRSVIAIGHFPPPVHGMAVAVEAFTAVLDGAAPEVVRVDIAGTSLERSAGYHLRRGLRVVRAGARLVATRSRTNRCYLGCDTGLGMAYTLALLAVARVLGYRVWLHHHSTAYLATRRGLFAVVAAIGGRGTVHLVACEAMAEQLRTNYGNRTIALLPLAFVVDAPESDAAPARPARVVVGHLSNLTATKGLPLVFDTVDALLADGIDVELRVAGAPWTDEDARYLDQRLAALEDGRARHVGPVYGPDKAAFLDGLDVFLFPSTYAHESFGIVTAEAQARGVPVVAFRAGCLNREEIGDGGLVIEPNEDFVEAASAFVRALADPARRQSARTAAAARSARNRDDAAAAAERLASEMAGAA
jgi:glycosyltransferase involved in cell wall biosynthesis